MPARTPSPPAAGSPARIPWQLADISEHTDGHRLMELVDVLMAVPQNIVHSPRTPAGWDARRDGPPVLVLDPRVPGQRPDSALGSVLGRPSPETPLAQHFAELMTTPGGAAGVDAAVELFRRQDADRSLAGQAAGAAPEPAALRRPREFGDAQPDHAAQADRAALHLACTAAIPGDADAIGDHRPLTASDLMSLRLPMPPRVALLACAIGRRLSIRRGDRSGGGDDPGRRTVGDRHLVVAAHHGGLSTVSPRPTRCRRSDGRRGRRRRSTRTKAADAGCAVNRWQREQMRRWRDGDVTASPLYWGALVTFAVDGAR